MTSLTFPPLADSDLDTLADWLMADTWPFHGQTQIDREAVLQRAREGFYQSAEAQTFWIVLDGHEKVGLIRLFDLEDPTPMFDLRLKQSWRGQGFGRQALQWLTGYIFETMPDKIRIEGQTRQDNLAMQRTFIRCGYTLECRYRRCWPTANGTYADSMGYGILREEWTEALTPQPAGPLPDDAACLRRAVELALESEQQGNLPVGAVIALDGQVIAEGRNQLLVPYYQPGAHAETEALRRVPPELWPQAREMTCYTTLEPCLMCYGALLLHGIGRVVFGAWDREGGARHILDHLPPFYGGGAGVPQWIGPEAPQVCDPLYERAQERFKAINPSD